MMMTNFGDYSSLPVEEAVRAARTGSRRRQVLDAAVKVMGQNGFHQMSMQELAAEAKVSVGLIYKYFGGKEDLLLAIENERRMEFPFEPHRWFDLVRTRRAAAVLNITNPQLYVFPIPANEIILSNGNLKQNDGY